MSKNKSEENLISINTPIDKILPNNQNMKQDILKFKDEILREIKLVKKSFTEKYDFFELMTKEKFSKYDSEFFSYTEKMNEIKSNLLISENITKEVNSFKEFKSKFSDTILTQNIKINNLEKETKNDIYRIDNILTDSVIYTGIIGRTSKFKTFHEMVDYLLSQTSQNTSYREKNIIESNQLKKKLTNIEQGITTLRDSLTKEINLLFKKKIQECNAKLDNMVEEYDKKILDARQKSIEFIQEIQLTVEKFKEQLDDFIVIKNKIAEEIKEEVNKLIKENDKTQNLFLNNKKEFNLMKDRFTQLSEFIKDIRFRINLGQEIKKKEFNQFSEKIDFSKKQKILVDKNLIIYDNKYQNNEYENPEFLKNGLDSEESKEIIDNKIKIKNYENTSKNYSHENIIITDKNHNKLTIEKNIKSDLNTMKGFKRRNTTKIKPFNFEKLKTREKAYSTINIDKENNKQNEISPNISPNKNINNSNAEGRNKLYTRRSMANEEMKNDSKRYSRFQNSISSRSKIFNGLTNRDNLNLKNYSSMQGKVKSNFEENRKLTIPQSKLTSSADNKPPETIKTNSNIYYMKKTTVKNLVRIQSAISPKKYPDIFNQMQKSNNDNNKNNNKSSFEDDKKINNKKKNKLINSEQSYVYFSYNKNKRNYNLRSYLSPNVKILQHSVENYNNKIEKKNLVEMVDTLQKYIKEQNHYYMNKKEKKEKNAEHIQKIKEIFNGNNNNKKYQKDKANFIKIKEKK